MKLPTIPPIDQSAAQAARQRQLSLTKPPGSLGRLEELAVQLAGMTGNPRPKFERKTVIIMAGDYGVCEEGVSAYPAEVTQQMVYNFLHGGAAINVLARQAGARVVIVDMGVAEEFPPIDGLIQRKIGRGTQNFARMSAMTVEQAEAAIAVGIEIVEQEIQAGADLIATGEMGIGNTSAASAMTAAFSGLPASEVTGRGTGIDEAGWRRKVQVIEAALELHRPDPEDGLDVLIKVGGFEIAGLAGVIIGTAAKRVPVVLDGFISGAAALAAFKLEPAIQPYLIASHQSVEVGHAAILKALDLQPLLKLDLRLGEGSGAALAFHLIEAASRILDEMATFEEAGVSNKE
ncbi:MAG: nicotinate-nucleotide--dimethylbenzimidazole phosphoribosyltransferase [Chloroflexi bacterium RBG_16_54_18]|nr:MAG: nicotinate-nucleotide--dimethylbenzimidazole phosphoribosyltransferase [Chloroflexi bacterium RBG_16_54_18]